MEYGLLQDFKYNRQSKALEEAESTLKLAFFLLFCV